MNNAAGAGHLRYRSDIDGLRAIAVVSVMIFHLNNRYLPGGYLGVDIFFVISGFLITGLITKEIEAGVFSYPRFYERRLRRLGPALVVVLLLSFVAASFLLYDSEKMRDFGGSMLHTVIGLSNFYFYVNSSYFDVESASRPLLHTWSLAVEEQFYLFWPILLILLSKTNYRTRIAILLIFSGASVIAGEYFIRNDPEAAFYLLPSRVCELAIGGIFFLLRSNAKAGRFDNKILGCAVHLSAPVILLLCFFLYNENTLFPGIRALPPALATGLLLLIPAPESLALILTNPVSQWLGLTSYSAYLIHWPVIVFYKFYNFSQISPYEELAIFMGSLVAASLMYHFIERPFRYRSGSDPKIGPALLLLSSTTGFVSIVFLSANVWAGHDLIHSQKNTVSAELEAVQQRNIKERNFMISEDGCHQFKEARRSDFSNCLKIVDGKPNIIVFGSSFAADDWLVFNKAYKDVNVSKITTQGCMSIAISSSRPHCQLTAQFIFSHITEIQQYDLIVISHNWDLDPNFESLDPFLDKIVKPVLIMGSRGDLNASMLDIVTRDGLYNPEQHLNDTFDYPTSAETRLEGVEYSKRRGVQYLDMYQILRDSAGLPVFVGNNNLLYVDRGHYTVPGAELAARKLTQKFPDFQSILNFATQPSLNATSGVKDSPVPTFETRRGRAPERIAVQQNAGLRVGKIR